MPNQLWQICLNLACVMLTLCEVRIDFVGPFQMCEINIRKSRVYKVYVPMFECVSVKAVVFDQFVAWCGLPNDIYSDCGINFVGASKQLRRFTRYP